MTPMAEREALETTSPSSALEVALGLALAGAVCALVALAQSASARAPGDEPALAPAAVLPSERSHASRDEAKPEASDSMELALLLLQRSRVSSLIDEAR